MWGDAVLGYMLAECAMASKHEWSGADVIRVTEVEEQAQCEIGFTKRLMI